MDQYVVKRRFQSLIVTGIIAVSLCFVLTLIYWPIWASLAKSIITRIAGPVLQQVDVKTAGKYITVFTEATFFWLVINCWIWQSLLFGGHGKTRFTQRQPWAGLWYSLVGFFSGAVGFMIIVGFLGFWWKPFNLGILFTPGSPEEVKMAIEGWEASNFYALTVIMVQIPFASLLQKWPFAGNIKAPWDGYGLLMSATVAALLVWFAAIIPSFLRLSIEGHEVVSQPMGSWPTFVAFCQCFIFAMLIPAEGGESYPMKAFAKKQPWVGLVGFVIALIVGFSGPALLRPVVGPLNLMPGSPVDLVIASLVLSCIITMLMWHHVFDDYPTAQTVPNQAARVIIRIVIWLVLGTILGIAWLKSFKMLPFGGNQEYGWPVMGVLAGQFAFLMSMLFYNTFFDKWPLVIKVKSSSAAQNKQVA